MHQSGVKPDKNKVALKLIELPLSTLLSINVFGKRSQGIKKEGIMILSKGCESLVSSVYR